MKTYYSNEEVLKDVKDGMLVVDDSIEIAFDGFNIQASIKCQHIVSRDYSRDINARDINAWDINARDINARDINAWDINARDINARDINARDIDAWDINARDINARDIDAWDINARDINARDIDARDILYHAFCVVYRGIKCLSIRAKREKHLDPICLDGKLEIKAPEPSLVGKEVSVNFDGKTYRAKIIE